jgi:hypothetical protein
MDSAQVATLAASLRHIIAGPSDTVSMRDLLLQRQLVAEMIEATQGNVTLQQALDGATSTAACGCSAPMAKVLELDPSDNHLVLRSKYGLRFGTLGQSAGKAEPGNPPGEALQKVAPVVDPDIRQRPPGVIPDILRENGVVTSVNVPLVNHDGAYGVLEVDFQEPQRLAPSMFRFSPRWRGPLPTVSKKFALGKHWPRSGMRRPSFFGSSSTAYAITSS